MGDYELVVRFTHTGSGEAPSSDEIRRLLAEQLDGLWISYITVEPVRARRTGLMPARGDGAEAAAVFREEQDG